MDEDEYSKSWAVISQTVRTGTAGVSAAMRSAWSSITTSTTSTWNSIKTTIQTSFAAVKSNVTSATAAVKSSVTSAWSAVKSLTTTSWNGMKSVIGTWYAIDETEIGGEKFLLLEHEEHGDMAACVAVNEQGKLVAEDLWNGFDEDFQEAVQKYLSEKWNMPKKENVVSEIIEKAVSAPDNSTQDYSDVPV